MFQPELIVIASTEVTNTFNVVIYKQTKNIWEVGNKSTKVSTLLSLMVVNT